MFPEFKKVCRMSAVAVVPVGMAAAFAFQAPVANAASGAAANRAITTGLTAVGQPRTLHPGGHGRARRLPRRLRAYRWAARQAGHPYVYGGTGPGFDCSGLVMMAYRHAGVHLPRTTGGMLASSLLRLVWH